VINYTKYIGIFFAALVTWYFGNTIYLYYYNQKDPVVILQDFQDNQYFTQNLTCKMIGSHPYKVATYSIFIDGKIYKALCPVHKANFESLISIPVSHLENGKHQIKFVITSGAKHKNSIEIQRQFYIDNLDLQASFIKPNSEHKVLQGRCLHLQFQVNKPIKQAIVNVLSHEYEAYPENTGSLIYETFIPVECEQHPSEYAFTLKIQDHVENNFDLQGTLNVIPFQFKKKMLNVPSGALDKEREFTNLTEKDFEADMEKFTQQSIREKLWQGVFEIPLAMTNITTEFGVMRVAQERGCYIHKALDMVAAAPRSVVWASQAGIIVAKERYVHSGNTIIIDHGWGILSMYFHLEEFANLQGGQKVRKGNPIGTMGKTGYANGYHLHWEIRVGNTAIDPMQWTKREFIS